MEIATALNRGGAKAVRPCSYYIVIHQKWIQREGREPGNSKSPKQCPAAGRTVNIQSICVILCRAQTVCKTHKFSVGCTRCGFSSVHLSNDRPSSVLSVVCFSVAVASVSATVPHSFPPSMRASTGLSFLPLFYLREKSLLTVALELMSVASAVLHILKDLRKQPDSDPEAEERPEHDEDYALGVVFGGDVCTVRHVRRTNEPFQAAVRTRLIPTNRPGAARLQRHIQHLRSP